jgi:serine/threonine protein kinase
VEEALGLKRGELLPDENESKGTANDRVDLEGLKNTEIEDWTMKDELQNADAGGMSEVHLAEYKDKRLGVWKESKHGGKDSPLHDNNERLEREYDILKILSDKGVKNVPEVFCFAEKTNAKGGESRVLLMEKIEGQSLGMLLEDNEDPGKLDRYRALGKNRSLKIFGELCEILENMADLNVDDSGGSPIYHRDINPRNVMVPGRQKGVVLIDFGLAKVVKGGKDVSKSKGGTIGWSPPERDVGKSGGYTDVYSMGQLLWCMLTGCCNRQTMEKLDIDTRKNSDFIRGKIEKALEGDE